MATDEKAAPGTAAPAPEAEPKIMCYVSKEMVPLSQTVEVEYGRGKPLRVQAKYVKFKVETAP